jgi:hypothetical protein
VKRESARVEQPQKVKVLVAVRRRLRDISSPLKKVTLPSTLFLFK